MEFTADTVMPFVILGIFVAVFVSIGIYYLLRFLKGSIKIYIPSQTMFFGEEIKGQITVVAKKEINANRIMVSLVCEEKHRSHSRHGSNTHWEEIYRKDFVLANSLMLPQATTRSYEFSVLTPTDSNVRSMPNFNNEMVNSLVSAFSGMMTMPKRWCIEARVDATGVDLKSRQYITLNQGARIQPSNSMSMLRN
jgi:hypothetical protein